MKSYNYKVDRYQFELGWSLDRALSAEAKAVLMLDCWPVNHTPEMKEFIRSHCPGLIIITIPAGGTGANLLTCSSSQFNL